MFWAGRVEKAGLNSLMSKISVTSMSEIHALIPPVVGLNVVPEKPGVCHFEVRHPRCVEPKLQNGKSTVKTQLYLLPMSGWIT